MEQVASITPGTLKPGHEYSSDRPPPPPRRPACGAGAAGLSPAAGTARGQPVRRRTFPGRSGRRPAVQSRARGRPVGDRRRLRGAVSAVFTAGSVRRRAAGPLGSPAGTHRRKPGATAHDDRRWRAAGHRRRRHVDSLRRVDHQRLHTLRLLGYVGRTAARRTHRTGGVDELGGHRVRGRLSVRRCQPDAAATLAARRGRRQLGRRDLAGGAAGRSGAVAGGALPPPSPGT